MNRLRPPLDFQVAILYALFGGLWILISDYLLAVMTPDTATLTGLQTYKGWFFVAASALFIFILLRRELILRQAAERQIGESEERYRLLFQNSMDAILLAEPDGSIHDANPAACMLFGRTEAEIRHVGRNGLVDLTDPRLPGALKERADTGRFYGELTFIRKDGSKFEGEVSSNLFRTQGVLERTSMIIRDISDRSRSEERLQLSEDRFSKAFFASPAGMTITRIADGKFIDANESFLRMFEFSREEVVGHTSTELNMWTREERHILIQAQIETGGVHDFELQARSKSGTAIFILFSSRPIDLEGETCHLTTMVDITERKRAEWALQESEQRFREMLENIQLLAVLLDLDGRVIFCNPYLLQLSGYTRQEVVGCDWFTQFIPYARPDVRETFLQGLAQGKLSPYYENPILTKSGEERLIRFSNTILRDAAGNIIGSTSIGEDITERRQAEEALRKSEQTYAVIFNKAPFAAGLARLSDGAYLEVNEEFERVFGFGRHEIAGKTSLELGLYPDAKIRERSAAMFREQGFVHNLDVRLLTRTGEAHDALINADLVEIGGEKYILTIANDITERKRAEEALQMRANELAALYQSAQRLQKIFTPETLAEEIVDLLEKNLSYEFSAILLIDASSGRLIPFAVAGRERGAEFVQQDKAYINLHEPRLGKGITGWVAERGESLRIGDVQKDERYYGLREDLHSELCVPLRAGDQVIGVINVETVKPDAYSAEDQRILETIAAHISAAIQNARLLEETRLSRDRLAELSRQLVQAYETERRAIGRELHDQIGQMLTALGLTLAVAPQLPPEQAARKFAGAQELVHDLSHRVSRLSLELRPPMLDDLGLIPALLWHINHYQEQTNIAVDFKHSRVEGSRFRSEIENTAYRLIQEALTNVARHARASQVRLALQAGDGQLKIEIEDNGQGFDAQAALAKHRGLSSMRERVGLLGGKFQIESVNKVSTKILINLPLEEDQT